jgi:uncharacterized protein (DUF2252 family)
VKAVTEGKVHRKRVNRSDLAECHPERRRRDPLEVLAEAEHGRAESLIRLKRQRMAASPFGFLRGAAPIMAYDLSLAPHTGITTQLCGDAHVQNLGAYAGIDGKLIFDINDFDETMRGPFEWDVKRMATSILLAGQQAGVGKVANRSAVTGFLRAYVSLMARLAKMPVLEAARYQVRRIRVTPPLEKVLAKAERASPVHLMQKLTKPAKPGRVFRSNPPVLTKVSGKEKQAVLGSIARYRASLLPERRHFLDQFRAIDVAFKVVGTGSVGLRDYCVYMEGNGPDDPLFLQIKQEAASVYAKYLPKGRGAKLEEGERVAEGQRAMQLQSDPMLGWTRFENRDYLVRQLNDHKATLDVTTLNADMRGQAMRV